MRTLSKTKINKLSPEVRQARLHLTKMGYTYQQAADVLGRYVTHVALVMSGRRTSKALTQKILNLPPNK